MRNTIISGQTGQPMPHRNSISAAADVTHKAPADLPADSTGGLEPVIAYLKANPSTTAVVSGYHDPSGDPAANEKLAKNRALAVQNALEGAGVDAGRIELEKPQVTTGSGSADDARRVEVTVRGAS